MQMLSPLCWTCRYRRVQCDGAEPCCSQCAAIGFTCSGYGATSSPTGLLADAADDKRGVLMRLNPDTVPDAVDSGMAYDPVPPLYNEAQMIFDGIHYFNERVSDDLISIGSHFNPYQVNLTRIDKIPRIYINLLVASATVHRAMQEDASFKRSSSALMQKEHDLYNFRIRALQEVNHRLSKTDTQTSDSTLMCVLCLLLSTMQQSAYMDWRAHLEGARKIIKLRGGLKEIIRKNVYFKPLMAFFVVIDIMAATTAPSTHENMYEATTMALHYWKAAPGIFQSNLAISAPCPEELFQTLILVNYLRAVSGKPDLMKRRHAGTRMVLEKLRSFSAPQWAIRMRGFMGWKSTGDGVDFDDNTRKQSSGSSVPEVSQIHTPISSKSSPKASPPNATMSTGQVTNASDTDLWLNIGIIYRAAILLYAIRTLILDLPDDKDYLFEEEEEDSPGVENAAHFDIPTLRLETRHILSDSLKPIFSNAASAHQLGKLVYLPMFVCGMEADEKEVQDFVAAGLEMVGRACGTLGPISAADELRGYWTACAEAAQEADGEAAHVTWDGYFTGRPDFIFGF
ncbi:fungal-specific transcription factor domain-containing protein [Xylariales sp. AK1849]|nr:fungal-specific transcription factor domain-containing protein [Xylariales sp. AK1849]